MAVSDYVIAAICGCWYRESHVNPAIWESLKVSTWDHQYQYDGIGGYGFGQWTNVGTSHGRLYKMYQWMTSHGYAMTSGDGECAYVLAENYWKGNVDTSSYPSLSRFMASASTDLDHLVAVFLGNWEGVPNDHIKERRGHASRFLKYIQRNKNKTSYKWHYGNTYDLGGGYTKLYSSSYGYETYANNSLANVIMVWRYFNGKDGGGFEPLPSDEHSITITVTGNGEAFPSSPSAEAGTIIDIYATPYGDDAFEGWSVKQGGVTVEFTSESPSWWRFTMGDEDVIIEARFTGETPENPLSPAKDIKAKSKIIYSIPWWAKYGL